MTTLSRFEDTDGLSDEKVLDAAFPGTKRKRPRKPKVSAPPRHDPMDANFAYANHALYLEPKRHEDGQTLSHSGAYGMLAGVMLFLASQPCAGVTNHFNCAACVATRALFETGDVAERLFDGLRNLAGIGGGRG